MGVDSRPVATAVVEPVDLTVPIESAVVSFARATRPAILESSLQNRRWGRYSLLLCDPIDEFTLGSGAGVCPFRSLSARVAAYPALAESPHDVPFAGGWVGFFTYEAGLTTERIESSTRLEGALPSVWFRLYDTVAIYDHRAVQWLLAGIDWPAGTVRRQRPVSERLASLRDRLIAASHRDHAEPPPPDTAEPIPNMSPKAYSAKVGRAKRHIEAGDIYQVNLTQRFTTQTNASPLDLYRRLRGLNPSPYAALLPWGRVAVLSSSPELFIHLRGGHVVTRPIKGTRPRVGDPVIDAAHRRELTESEKERAELTMIVDLLRNDLGRVCSFGSVRVTEAGGLEEHPTVFHRVATIEGDLTPDRTWVDLLRAAFPGGSVTGAPKIRAMQIIDELEETPRGVYCGAIGSIGLDGSVSLNVAIRTMVQRGETVHLYAGGAIVADSMPEHEYEETIAKATGMLRALGCAAPAHAARVGEATVS